jgi:adenylate kinase family enzyme
MPSSIIDTFTDSDRVQKGTILSGLVRIQGNKAAIDDVVKSVRKRIDEGKELYETEDLLKLELIEKYGKAWFDDNGEAINFIVENEYSLSLYNRQGGK